MILSRFIFLYSVLVNFIISHTFLPETFPLNIVLRKIPKPFVSSLCFFYVVQSLPPRLLGKKKIISLSGLCCLPSQLFLLIFFLISFLCFVQISSDAAQPLASSPSLQAAAEKSKAEVYWFWV